MRRPFAPSPEAKMLRSLVRASVSREHDRPRNRLVREQPVDPQIVARKSEVTGEAAVDLLPNDRVVCAGVVVELRLLLGVVLPDDTEEDRSRDLIFDLEPRDLANADGAAVRLPVVLDVLVLRIDAKLVDRPEAQVAREVHDIGGRPLVEVLVLTPDPEQIER